MSLDLFPSMVHDNDISRDVASSELDDVCQQIHDACKGFGTNEKALIQALGSVSQADRYKLPIRYEQMFETTLRSVIKSECGKRPMGKSLEYLSVNPVDAECIMIYEACSGVGTNEFLLTTIICGRSNKEVDVLKKSYFELVTKDLTSTVASEAKGHFEQLLISALQGVEDEYDASTYDEDKTKEDIKKLYNMGLGKGGCDEAGIFKFLCSAPPEYLKKINIAFAEEYGYTLMMAFEREFSGDIERAATFILGIKINPHEQIAKLINKACAGFGTDEKLLSTILVRYQGMMNEVKLAYVDLFGKTIQDTIKSECAGDYEDLLQLIVGE